MARSLHYHELEPMAKRIIYGQEVAMPRLLTDEESRQAQLKKCGIACFGTTYETRDIAILEAQANLTRQETAREIIKDFEEFLDIDHADNYVQISNHVWSKDYEQFKSRYLEGK